MIPKIIHYCWFGDQPIKQEYAEYINEWKQLNPDFEIKKWDISNIPSTIPYLNIAVKQQNWANVSNYIRLYALRTEGGIYMDTDMKNLCSLTSLLNHHCFLGFESGNSESEDFWVNNAIMGSMPDHEFVRECEYTLLERFDGREKANLSAPHLITDILKKKYQLTNYGEQLLSDIMIFEKEVFYPLPHEKTHDKLNLKKYITSKTICVHLWERSWYSPSELLERIDAQNRFIDTHLNYIDNLELKLNSASAHLKEEVHPYLLYRREMFTDFNTTLKTIQQHMNSLQDQVNLVTDHVTGIRSGINNHPDNSGVNFAINFLSARLQETESKLNDIIIKSAIQVTDITAKLIATETKLEVTGKRLLEKDFKLKDLEKQIHDIAATSIKNEAALTELTSLIRNINTAIPDSALTHYEPEINEQTNINTSSEQTAVHEPNAAQEKIIQKLETDNCLLADQLNNAEGELRKKIEENEILSFRLNSLTGYIDSSARDKQLLEDRIMLLEDIIQKMRLKNRAKRLLGLYKQK